VVLVKKLRTELADKKLRMEKLTDDSKKSSTTESISFRKRRKLDIEERTEHRAISMVVM
jgi:hypothetical protein